MHRVSTVVLSVICVALLGVATNVATGALPERWSPYLWLAWPLLILLILALVAVEVARAREPEPTTVAGAARARRVLLERVRRYWVTSVLERSLHEEARIELGIAATADDRRHPWSLRASHRDGFADILDDQTAMATLFDRLDRAVVILGAPGAGKTTTLLELARDLVARAETDPEAPIPVVLNLSSWATSRRPLARWLAEQLTERYGIPPAQAAAWVDAGEILPLLDGLDEVAEEHRDGCAVAIADFHARQPLTPLAVCCREIEYQQLRRPLPVYGTVTIQPLTQAQIERYVDRTGLTGLRAALAADPELWKLTDSPLLLSIMALAYADGEVTAPEAAGSGRDRLFTRYVETMLRRRPHPRYTPELTAAYLSTLAEQLRRQRQTLFVLDLIDETWSPRYPRHPTAALIARIAGISAIAPTMATGGWLLAGPVGLVTAAGVFALALALIFMFDGPYSGLSGTGLPTRTHWAGPDGRPTGSQATWRNAFAARPPLLPVWILVLVAAGVGAAAGALAGTGGPAWTAGLGYGAGFLLAAHATFATFYAAQILLVLRRPELRGGRRELPSPLLRQRFGTALRAALAIAAVTACPAWVAVAPAGGVDRAADFALVVGTGCGLLILVLVALAPMAEQWLVRRRLARQQVVPYPLVPFLSYAVQCLLLRQVGDGHIFVHRELLDHFADRAAPPGAQQDRRLVPGDNSDLPASA
jgi:hypothetical protein